LKSFSLADVATFVIYCSNLRRWSYDTTESEDPTRSSHLLLRDPNSRCKTSRGEEHADRSTKLPRMQNTFSEFE